MIQSGVYNVAPSISAEDWGLLVDYIISNAPDSLRPIDSGGSIKSITQFSPYKVEIDGSKGSLITFVKFDPKKNKLITADLKGKVVEYDGVKNEISQEFYLGNPITSYTEIGGTDYITSVGILDPSEISAGRINLVGREPVGNCPSNSIVPYIL